MGCNRTSEDILALRIPRMIYDLFVYFIDLPRWHFFAFSVVGYVCYYFWEVVKRPILAVSEGPFKQFLLKNVPTLEMKFWPTFWCVESRAQTVFASILRSQILPRINYRREVLTLKDGGEVALDWLEDGCEPDAPLILILPGLTGESQAEYIKCLVTAANLTGIRTVVFNNRGLGGIMLKTPRLYCAANCEDLSEVVQHVRQLNPMVKLGATGISMGGLILGNYLAEHSDEARRSITAAKIISVPWDILPRINYRREVLTLKDGGEVALDWLEDGCEPDAPLILILPGLTGESQAEYIKCLVTAANLTGIRTVVFNNRGLGGIMLKTPRLYCAANCEDLSEVVQHVRQLNPMVKLGATGISMGGLILGNYLAEHSDEARRSITAAKIISVPWDVKKGTASIEKPYLNSMLGRHLAGSLCATVSKYDIFQDGKVDMTKVLQSKTIKEFDANFTSKQFGFKDVDSYYEAATLHNKLHKIKVPLLCLSAADDPFQPLDGIPIKAAEKSSHVAIVVTARGGHIGFLEGWWPSSKDQYMGRLFSQFFSAALFDTTKDFERTSQNMMIGVECTSRSD
uniref:Putative phospholipase abhd3 n=1 Tax=Lutzomyia longipalpis TaxID=7200 RepID=A0A1B0CY64_LUTLO